MEAAANRRDLSFASASYGDDETAPTPRYQQASDIPAIGAARPLPYHQVMALHILKLCVGIESIADLEHEIAERLRQRASDGRPREQVHTTRMVPKRIDEIIDGGSLFWVIKGQVCARQTVLAIRPFTDLDGIGRCHLVLDPVVVPVLPKPCRPFQGWRYLAADAAPADLAGPLAGAAGMPEHLRYALRELCLL